MPLFEVAMLKQPTQNEKDDGAKEGLIWGPTCIVAANSQNAALQAAKSGEEGSNLTDLDMDRVEVLVRPF